MALWKRLWLVFAAIWIAVAGLNVFAILALGDNPPEAALRPLLLMVAVPALVYLAGAILARRRGAADDRTSRH